MKKIFAVLLVFVLIISLSACGNDANLNTDSTSIDTKESSSTTDNISSTVEVSIPDAYFGLIDENEKPYGEGKIFGWGETRTFKLTCSDNKGLTGKFEYYVNGEKSNSFDWKYIGNGIYVEDHVQPYKYFLHQGYFVRMGDVGALFSSKLSGSSDTGYEYDDGFYRFYKNGKYDYGYKDKKILGNGSYEMVTEHIMKLTVNTGDSTIISYYMIDKENYMHCAYPQVRNY